MLEPTLEFPKANPERTECKLHFGDCPLKGIMVYAPRSLRCGGSRIVAGHWVPCFLLAAAAREDFVEALHSVQCCLSKT